jgi:hypothetical protein
MGPAVCAAGIRRWEFFIKSSYNETNKLTLEQVNVTQDDFDSIFTFTKKDGH